MRPTGTNKGAAALIMRVPLLFYLRVGGIFRFIEWTTTRDLERTRVHMVCFQPLMDNYRVRLWATQWTFYNVGKVVYDAPLFIIVITAFQALPVELVF